MKSTKQVFLSLVLFAMASFANAQTTDMGFSFQGYAIDPDGKSIGSTGITVKFTLTPGTFTEEHTTTSDAFGVFHAIVGNSSVAKKAEFAKLDFTKKATVYTLQVEVKKTSGGTYTTISNAPMVAVPYARVAANGVPVGTIVAYGGDVNNVPEGWKLCDGSSVLQTDYPQLYAAIGSAWGTSGSSFNLPDLRGRFLRGVDGIAGAGGNDPDDATRTANAAGGNTGNTVGTLQGDGNLAHTHTGTTNADGSHAHNYTDQGFGSETNCWAGGACTGGQYAGAQTSRASVTSSDGAHSHNFTTASSGGEARPKNASVYYIIKY